MVYGLVGLKIHAKTVLVIRDEPDGVRRYCHVGTGNYNPKTARIYEDIGILTADRAVGEDLTQLFNYLTGYGRDISYQRLLVAPTTLRSSFDRLIANEIEAPEGTGRITLKMNSLVDARLIDRLYEASQAGVEIDLIVRGICCLRPGVPGLSDNIRVRSLVGRNLEHSRIYYFANGGVGPRRRWRDGERFYIGSADLMPRNLDRRVEVLVRVDDEYCQDRLRQILKVNLADTELAGTWPGRLAYERLDGTFNAHDEFERLAGRASGRWAARAPGWRPPADAVTDRRRLPRGPEVEQTSGTDDGDDGADEIVRAAGCVVFRQGDDGSRCWSSTGPATTTGTSPRASWSRARPISSAPCGRPRRSRASGARWWRNCRPTATWSRGGRRSCAGGCCAGPTGGSSRTTRSTRPSG